MKQLSYELWAPELSDPVLYLTSQFGLVPEEVHSLGLLLGR